MKTDESKMNLLLRSRKEVELKWIETLIRTLFHLMNELSFNTRPLKVPFIPLLLPSPQTEWEKWNIFHKSLWIYSPEPRSVWLLQERRRFGHGLLRAVQTFVSRRGGPLINVNICIHRSIWVLPPKVVVRLRREKKETKIIENLFFMAKIPFYLFPVSHRASS